MNKFCGCSGMVHGKKSCCLLELFIVSHSGNEWGHPLQRMSLLKALVVWCCAAYALDTSTNRSVESTRDISVRSSPRIFAFAHPYYSALGLGKR